MFRKRDWVESNGGFDVIIFAYAVDYDFFQKLIEKGNIQSIDRLFSSVQIYDP